MAAKIDSNDVEDILGLTIMQRIMLFNYLFSGGGSDYKEHTRYKLTGEKIDYLSLVKAWQYVVMNNEMLRVVYRWKKINNPVQIVLKNNVLRMDEHDISAFLETEKQNEADRIDENDKREEIDLEECPIRVVFCKLSDHEYEMCITNHHILFDGWSNAIILKEFLEAYKHLVRGEELERQPKGKYKEYIKWLNQQDSKIQKDFWTSYLKDYQVKTCFPMEKGKQYREENELFYSVSLQPVLKEKLYGYAKEKQVTVAACLYSIYGMIIGTYTGLQDVVFGATLSIRPPEIRGVEDIVGLFINTVPIRVTMNPEQRIEELIESVSMRIKEVEEYAGTSMMDINSCSGCGQGEQLYDSIIVVQNYPLEILRFMEDSPLRLELYSRTYKTKMNVTLTVRDFDTMFLDFTYNINCFQPEDMELFASQYIKILENVICNEENEQLRIRDIELVNPLKKEKVYCNPVTQNTLFQDIEEVDFDEIF